MENGGLGLILCGNGDGIGMQPPKRGWNPMSIAESPLGYESSYMFSTMFSTNDRGRYCLYVRLLYGSKKVGRTQPPKRGCEMFSINERGSFVQLSRRGTSLILAYRSFQGDMTVRPDAMFDVRSQPQRSGAIRMYEEVTHPQHPSIAVQAGPGRTIGNFGSSLLTRIWRHLAAQIGGKWPRNCAIFSYSA